MVRLASRLVVTLAIGSTALGLTASPVAGARARVIVVTDSIQAAVDAAEPGDTIVVPPGTYQGGVVVDKSDITIKGSRAAIIEATGHQYGIQVGTAQIGTGPDGNPVCPPLAMHGITIDGLTIQHAEDTGVRLIGVDGFRLTHGRYVDNEEYGPFPICSANGLIDFNEVSGTEDAGIYVGDDTGVTVANNHVTDCAIGVEIENSVHSVVRNNKAIGNTVGILVVLLPGLPMPVNDDTAIEGNVVDHNNLPNPVPADSGDEVGLLPTGTGILNVGGDHVIVNGNTVVGNDSVGVAIIQSPFGALDPRLEVNPDNNAVRANLILHNGNSPDPVRATTPGADIVYDGTGTGNCFGRNVFKTEFPSGITALFPCAGATSLAQ